MMFGMTLTEIFVANVRRIMSEKSPPWTQMRLADAMGVKPPTITTMLKGNVWPSNDRIESVATALGVTPAELLSDSSATPLPTRPPLHPLDLSKIEPKPILGVAGAGPGRAEIAPGEMVDVRREFRGANGYVVVHGDSMVRDGILDGDRLTVLPREIQDGDRVVAWIAKQEGLVIKILRVDEEGNRVLVGRGNDAAKPMRLREDRGDHVYGAYAGLIRTEGTTAPPAEKAAKGKRKK
jgi:SOS-response transcriptional repressor LexA